MCSPSTSSPAARAAPTATSASSASRPNLEPRWPVRIASCVSATTPGVTRMSTRRTPASAARAGSSSASIATSAPASAAPRNSSSDLLFPCTIRFGPSIPAFLAYASSPREATSAPKPSSASRRMIATFGNAFVP